MKALTYAEARGRFRPGDALLTAEPGFTAGAIRWLTGDAWSHIAGVVEGREPGRRFVAEAHAKSGIGCVRASKWLEHRHGRVLWIPAFLTLGQAARFTSAAENWYGSDYEGAKDFILQALGHDPEKGKVDDDKVCSAFYAALWLAATGDDIPGRPWLKWLRGRAGRHYVPTPGAVHRYLADQGCQPVELVR